jgi:serine/threonine protein kinase
VFVRALEADDPRSVGGYRILGRLGEGGMGRVYLARSTTGRSVALKVVHDEMAALPGFRARFEREVEVARRVSGAGTVPVVDAGVADRHPWYASACVPGPSLQAAVEAHGPLPEESVWRFAADLARTLEHIHRAHVVHRDLKPANVLLSAAGPRLIDFGIVHAALETGLTSSGARIGTPAYMSPEQAYGRPVTGASDIYSLGLTLAFAATGENPRRLAAGDPDLTGVSSPLMLLIRHCLAPDPEQRPTAADVQVRARHFDTTVDSWLPAPVASAIARTSEELLNFEAAAEAEAGTAGAGPEPTVADAPNGPGPDTAFHSARTQTGDGGPGRAGGPSRPQDPPPFTAPPRPTPPPHQGTWVYEPSAHGTRRAPGDGPPLPDLPDWTRRGLLGRPLLGWIWLAWAALTSYLVFFAQPAGFWTVFRVLGTTALFAGSIWLTAAKPPRWVGFTTAYWLLLAFFTVQAWWSVSAYQNYRTTVWASGGKLSGYQNLVDGLGELLNLPLALGSLAMIYVVPAAFVRHARFRRERARGSGIPPYPGA